MEVAASVIGLLTAGAQITLILQTFIQSAVSAPALARRIHHEVHEFDFILSKLQPIVLGTTPLNRSRASLIDIHHLSFTLAGCVCTFSEIEKEVTDLKCTGKMDIMDRIRWGRAESTFKPLIERLQSHKLSLTLILTILTSQSNLEAESCKQSLDKQVTAPTLEASSSALAGTAQPPPSAETPGPSTPSHHTASADVSSGSWAASISSFAFQSTLFNTRLYQKVLDKAGISPASADRPAGRWSWYSGGSNMAVVSLPISMYTMSGASLAHAPKIADLPLPISGDNLFNSQQYYFNKINIASEPIASRPDIATKGIDIPIKKSRLSSDPITLWVPSQYGAEMPPPPTLLPAPGRYILLRLTGGDTELHTAVMYGDEMTVQLLLERRVEINAKDNYGNTALHLAVWYWHETIVQILLKQGADTDTKNENGDTALHFAAWGGKARMVQALLERIVDVNVGDINGDTPMHLAIKQQHCRVVQALLDGGQVNMVTKNKLGYTVSEEAVRCGNALGFQLLRDHTADLETRDMAGNTPTFNAQRGYQDITLQMPPARGVNMVTRGNYAHPTPGGGEVLGSGSSSVASGERANKEHEDQIADTSSNVVAPLGDRPIDP